MEDSRDDISATSEVAKTIASSDVSDVADRLYRKKQILAPMVRASTLPLRRLALKYGADTVYTEEIIDHKLLRVERVENSRLNTVDYLLKPRNENVTKSTKKGNAHKRLVLRLHPETERGRLVLQIGTNDAVRALRGVQKFARDISAVDINMCCPKHFSISGGMGCALLRKPETACDIIRTLRRNLSIPVSCKMRMLDANAGDRIDRVASEQVVRASSKGDKCTTIEKVEYAVRDGPGDGTREMRGSRASLETKSTRGSATDDTTTTIATTDASRKRNATVLVEDVTCKSADDSIALHKSRDAPTTKTKKRRRREKTGRRKTKKANTDIGTLLAVENLDDAVRSTAQFMRQMEAAGAAAIAVHLRTASERRENPAHLETSTLRTLSSCVRVPFIVNGDAFSRETADKIRSTIPGCSIMYARGALRNPSIFRHKGALSRENVVKEYVEEAVRFENHYMNTKYVVMHSMKEVGETKGARWNGVSSARSNRDICDALGMDFSTLLHIRETDADVYEDGHKYDTSYFDRR